MVSISVVLALVVIVELNPDVVEQTCLQCTITARTSPFIWEWTLGCSTQVEFLVPVLHEIVQGLNQSVVVLGAASLDI
ncbi:hypothetical protein Mapa_006830 [Marchantia paleacea]|nr:hypothetical protein Mapa_006830 [Marchantia paleacea]